MKRFIALLLACSMMLALAACGSSSSDDTEDTEEETTEEEETEETEAEEEEETEETEEEEEETETEDEEEEETESSDDEPVYGGSATFYYPKLYNYFDPAAKNQFGYMLWMDCLFQIDWGLNDPDTWDFTSTYLNYEYIAGQAAESWEIADDWSYIDITIHDDIYFQEKEDEEYNIFNGRQLTAEDVAYTFNRLLGLDGVEMVECETDWTTELYMVESVEVLDELTVRVNFNTATENALNDFMYECAISVGLTGEEWDELTEDQKSDWHYAIGTGAYILTDYVADNYMQFEANPNYYGEDERYPGNQLPYIDSVKLVYIADSDNILTQFIAGELDWFGGENSGTGLLTTSQIEQLKASMDEEDYEQYYFETGSPAGIGLRIDVEPFDDINVRIAMQHAINCEEIWNEYYAEETELEIPGLWSKYLDGWSVEWTDEMLEEYTYDPDLAVEMLAEAGYADGFDMEIVLDPLADQDLYVLVQQYLAEVGINVTLTPVSEVMEHNSIVTTEGDTRCFNGYAGNFSSISDAYGMTCTGGFGYGLFHNNTVYDDLMTSLQNATDLASAAEYAQQMDEIFITEHWILTFGGCTTASEFMSGRIGGYTGETVYNLSNMRTIFARLWVTDGE